MKQNNKMKTKIPQSQNIKKNLRSISSKETPIDIPNTNT